MTTIYKQLKARIEKLEQRIKRLEDGEAHKKAILDHMKKHRIQMSIRNKLKPISL